MIDFKVWPGTCDTAGLQTSPPFPPQSSTPNSLLYSGVGGLSGTATMPKMIKGQGEELSSGYRISFLLLWVCGTPWLECVLESKHKPSGRHRKESTRAGWVLRPLPGLCPTT